MRSQYQSYTQVVRNLVDIPGALTFSANGAYISSSTLNAIILLDANDFSLITHRFARGLAASPTLLKDPKVIHREIMHGRGIFHDAALMEPWLVGVTTSGLVYVWDVGFLWEEPPKVVARICELTGRWLSEDEWVSYVGTGTYRDRCSQPPTVGTASGLGRIGGEGGGHNSLSSPEPVCNRKDSSGPVAVDQAQFAARFGANAKKFSEVGSTKAQPVEGCGVRSAYSYLLRLTCDDGSNPLESRADAQEARVGNVGSGGRCESIIDRYLVECPEKTYSVFFDGHVCPESTKSG